jgi:hypothetical protein
MSHLHTMEGLNEFVLSLIFGMVAEADICDLFSLMRVNRMCRYVIIDSVWPKIKLLHLRGFKDYSRPRPFRLPEFNDVYVNEKRIKELSPLFHYRPNRPDPHIPEKLLSFLSMFFEYAEEMDTIILDQNTAVYHYFKEGFHHLIPHLANLMSKYGRKIKKIELRFDLREDVRDIPDHLARLVNLCIPETTLALVRFNLIEFSAVRFNTVSHLDLAIANFHGHLPWSHNLDFPAIWRNLPALKTIRTGYRYLPYRWTFLFDLANSFLNAYPERDTEMTIYMECTEFYGRLPKIFPTGAFEDKKLFVIREILWCV